MTKWVVNRAAWSRDEHLPPLFPNEDLLLAIKSLPEPQRLVLTLKVFGDLTFKQIATLIDTSVNTAASRYRYAVQKLQHKLDRKRFSNMKSDNKLPAQPASPCSKETDDAKAPSPDSLRPPRPQLRSRIMTDIDGILKQPHVRNWDPFT